MSAPRICVVGSANIDLVSFTPRQPVLGETLHGTSFMLGYGGKAANQAVAAAKLGARCHLVAKLGRDVFGEGYLKHLKAAGVDTSLIGFTSEAFSGTAAITVDPDGRNAIIIVAGANGLLCPADVEAAGDILAASDVVVCQLEAPVETTLAALRFARRAGVRTILNPAPALPELPSELYAVADIFCPNESEAAMLSGRPLETLVDAEEIARSLLARGPRAVILTLGERGSLLLTPDEVSHVSAPKVKAVDTTGAGDAYVGSLAFGIAQGKALAECMRLATKVASLSVQKPGTQASYPTWGELGEAR
jgi:ribokinase